MPPTDSMDPFARQEVRLVRLEEQVRALADDVAELKEELRQFRRALIAELRASHKAKQARTQMWLTVLQPKSLVPIAIVVVSIVAAISGLAFTWGEFSIAAEP